VIEAPAMIVQNMTILSEFRIKKYCSELFQLMVASAPPLAPVFTAKIVRTLRVIKKRA
jgi:hypothetical protein